MTNENGNNYRHRKAPTYSFIFFPDQLLENLNIRKEIKIQNFLEDMFWGNSKPVRSSLRSKGYGNKNWVLKLIFIIKVAF